MATMHPESRAVEVEASLSSAVMVDFEHLQWLHSKEQQVLSRGRCLAALRAEASLLHECKACIAAHRRALEHCRAASDINPEWFTLDVQQGHARKIEMLRLLLETLVSEPLPAPEESGASDRLWSGLLSTGAKATQTTMRVSRALEENQTVKAATAGVLSAVGGLQKRWADRKAAAEAAAAERSAAGSSPSASSKSTPQSPIGVAGSPAQDKNPTKNKNPKESEAASRQVPIDAFAASPSRAAAAPVNKNPKEEKNPREKNPKVPSSSAMQATESAESVDAFLLESGAPLEEAGFWAAPAKKASPPRSAEPPRGGCDISSSPFD